MGACQTFFYSIGNFLLIFIVASPLVCHSELAEESPRVAALPTGSLGYARDDKKNRLPHSGEAVCISRLMRGIY